MIQNILILKNSGLNVFNKCFGEIPDFDKDLVSGFFSAFFAFTQQLWHATFQDILLGDYRILFEWIGKEKDSILVAIIDVQDSIINVKSVMLELKKVLERNYGEILKSEMCASEDFKGLDEIIEDLISKSRVEIIPRETIFELMDVLGKFVSKEEVLDCALLTINGAPLINSNPREFLDIIIEQLDSFWRFKTRIVDQIILYYENRYVILLKLGEKYIFATLFERETPIGLATMLIEDVSDRLLKFELSDN